MRPGNFHPLQLRFPHQLEGPASPAKARCDGGVLSMDWRSCGVGMPVRDLFMALVPWMTYLPRCGTLTDFLTDFLAVSSEESKRRS